MASKVMSLLESENVDENSLSTLFTISHTSTTNVEYHSSYAPFPHGMKIG